MPRRTDTIHAHSTPSQPPDDEPSPMKGEEQPRIPPKPRRPLFRSFSFSLTVVSLVAVLVAAGILSWVVVTLPRTITAAPPPSRLSPQAQEVLNEIVVSPRGESRESVGAAENRNAEAQAVASSGEPTRKIRVRDTETGWLNVRAAPSLNGTRLTRVYPGEVYPFDQTQQGWYHIQYAPDAWGWVHGSYVEEVSDQ